MLKVFFIVLIGSVINLAQIPNAYLSPDNSLHNIFSKSLEVFDLIPQSLASYFSYINSNIFNERDSTRQRMDSIIANSITGGKLKLLFEYDNNNNIIEQLSLGWESDTGWSNRFNNEYFYNEDQKLILHLNFGWNVSNWDSLFKINYFYNSQGQVIYYIFQEYVDRSWENYQRVSFEYDLNGNEIQRLTEEWQNSWLNLSLNTNYFSNVNRRDSLIVQVWNSNEWGNYGKTAFTYNQLTEFLEYFISKIWNNGTWKNYINRRITNDQNGNQTFQIDQLWNGNNWENSIRRFFTYDGLNYTSTAYCELWNGTDWYLDDGDIIIENPDGFRMGFLMNNVFIYYKTTGVPHEMSYFIDNFVLYQNYPNPFNSTTKIEYIIPQSGNVTLKIYDLIGNEVATVVDKYQTTGSYNVTFQVNNLSSGIYFYKLQVGRFIATKKLIFLK